MKLSEKILYLRKKEGMSQEDLADAIGVSRQTIYKWESDAATPEIAKIKQLAKLFNVSFDYLMDENTENVDEKEKKEPEKIKYRYTYNSRGPLDPYQADKDHGYYQGVKRKVKDSTEIFGYLNYQMKSLMNKIGADHTILLQGDMAACFFENSKEKFFGFYYAGNIQFLCPFENFINIHLSDSGENPEYKTEFVPHIGFNGSGISSVGFATMPRPTLTKAEEYTVIVSYLDESENIAEFKFDIDCTRTYVVYEDPNNYSVWAELQSEFAYAKLNDIYARMKSYPVIAQKIANREIEVKELDVENLQSIIKKAASNINKHESNIQNKINAAKARKKKIRTIVIWSIVAIIVLSLIFDGASKSIPSERIFDLINYT